MKHPVLIYNNENVIKLINFESLIILLANKLNMIYLNQFYHNTNQNCQGLIFLVH